MFTKFLKNKNKKISGFSLIELLVVIAIVGLLTTIAVVAVNNARYKAKEAVVLNDLKVINDAMSTLVNDTNLWPGEQAVDTVSSAPNNEICGEDVNSEDCGARTLSAGISGLLATNGNYGNWQGPYVNSMPIDPWGNEYFFDTDYSLDINNEPCGCGAGGCVDAVVLGSYGQDMAGKPVSTATGAYGCDDIIRIIYKN
ncbi:MAG: prepilin-type N-terminal cleavage/methylation domain-containing protein [Patescibacteria group bacterium]|nr:prepilin-type N-terminal cleavage/methylation domain-containing protein [Patescibacteria group bacterium]